MKPIGSSLRSISGILWLTIWSLLPGCISVETEEPPVITLHSPLNGSHYHVSDTIHVEASVSSVHDLEYVSVTLLNISNQPVLAPDVMNHPANPYQLSIGYLLSDSLMDSGDYILRVQAFDGISITNAFTTIHVEALPVLFRYPLIVTSGDPGRYKALSLTDEFTWQTEFEWQGDYSASALDSRNQLLFVCGRYHTGLQAVDLNTNQVLWNSPPGISPQNRWFEGISFLSPYVYVSRFDGYVSAFDSKGSLVYATVPVSKYYPYLSFRHNNYLFSALYNPVDDSYALGQFHFPGGILKELFSPLGEIRAILPLSSSKLMIFGNNDPDGIIQVLDLNVGSLITVKTLQDEKISKVAAMDPQNYFVACESAVFWYRFSGNSLTPFTENVSATAIACEPLSREIFLSTGTQIFNYSYPEGQLLTTFTSPDPVLDILLLYSK